MARRKLTPRQAAAREALIVQHMPMVERIARKESHQFAPHLDIRDLIQAGYVGLVEAADRYQPKMGPFERFAYFRVRGAIIDANRRRAYREELNDSVEAINERLGFLPAEVTTDTSPLPDELAAERQAHERREKQLLAAALALPPAEGAVLLQAIGGEKLAVIGASHGRSLTWTRVKLTSARTQVTAALKKAA